MTCFMRSTAVRIDEASFPFIAMAGPSEVVCMEAMQTKSKQPIPSVPKPVRISSGHCERSSGRYLRATRSGRSERSRSCHVLGAAGHELRTLQRT